MAKNSPGPVANIFATPTKGFITQSTPKNTFGEESVSSKAVKEKAKYAVLFYCLFLSSKYADKNTNQEKLILGNLSEDFITSLNISTQSESICVFNNAFSTYWKNSLNSENYLGTVINFPHINHAMNSLLVLGEF